MDGGGVVGTFQSTPGLAHGMSQFKIAGHCTSCDTRCFDIEQRFEDHEMYPGEPKRLGLPTEDAQRITFLLYDGSKMDLTFCGNCEPENYPEIWRKVMRSWRRELKGETPDWFKNQVHNGLLLEASRKPWKAYG